MSDADTIERPPTNRHDDRWRWPRRVLAAAALAAAIAFVVVAAQRAPSSEEVRSAADPAVVHQTPAPGTHALRQTRVGAELLPGYDGQLTIDGRAIPEDQLDNAIGPDHPGYDPELGVRPNTRNQVFFTPGPEKELDRYGSGEVDVELRLWKIADGPSAARTISWVFFVN